ncbi:hypothetical protein NUW58_g9984 [Xylaria curta]|uniref:Uncharacterized protein n=1 Tax=Xylaria curta TaxID=42375 RepID=A0ACC1MR24_9PEZI|nr:hypothetical protein NUW58_g9984 [Xylaria curta]
MPAIRCASFSKRSLSRASRSSVCGSFAGALGADFWPPAADDCEARRGASLSRLCKSDERLLAPLISRLGLLPAPLMESCLWGRLFYCRGFDVLYQIRGSVLCLVRGLSLVPCPVGCHSDLRPRPLAQRGVLPPECVPGCGCAPVAPALVAKRRAVEKEKLKDGLRRWVGGVWRGEVKERSESVKNGTSAQALGECGGSAASGNASGKAISRIPRKARENTKSALELALFGGPIEGHEQGTLEKAFRALICCTAHLRLYVEGQSSVTGVVPHIDILSVEVIWFSGFE